MTRPLSIALLAVGALSMGAGCKNRTNRPGDTLACAPGEALTVGCTAGVGSMCSGDPVMDACDGTIAPSMCTDTTAFAMDDDSGADLCPVLQTTCPASGRITISVHGFRDGAYQCYWDIVHGGGSTDAGGRG
jgi:hypothetical protein